MYNVTIMKEDIRKLISRGYVIEEKKGELDILSFVSEKKVVEMIREGSRIIVMTKDTYEVCRRVDNVTFNDVSNKILISMDSGNKMISAE